MLPLQQNGRRPPQLIAPHQTQLKEAGFCENFLEFRVFAGERQPRGEKFNRAAAEP
jgi:hypothetical protein